MTMTIATSAEATAGPATPVVVGRRHHSAMTAPNYLRRRIAAAAVAFALVAATATVLATALAGLGGVPAAASGVSLASPPPAVHVARPGDTLWSIAGDHRGGADHRRYLDALIDLNGGTSIEVGQAVLLP